MRIERLGPRHMLTIEVCGASLPPGLDQGDAVQEVWAAAGIPAPNEQESGAGIGGSTVQSTSEGEAVWQAYCEQLKANQIATFTQALNQASANGAPQSDIEWLQSQIAGWENVDCEEWEGSGSGGGSGSGSGSGGGGGAVPQRVLKYRHLVESGSGSGQGEPQDRWDELPPSVPHVDPDDLPKRGHRHGRRQDRGG